MWSQKVLFCLFLWISILCSCTEARLPNIGTRLPSITSRLTNRCGETFSTKQVTLTSPTQQLPVDCVYTFRAKSRLVCQVRVDFDTTLAPPTLPTAANLLQFPQCLVDVFEINGLRICGTNRNQHIYIPLNKTDGTDSVVIRIRTANRINNPTAPVPSWNIQATQLECSSGSGASLLGSLRSRGIPGDDDDDNDDDVPEGRTFFHDGFWVAPIGCTQYFPEDQGVVQSFNFQTGTGLYPGDLRYSICFRRTIFTTQLELTFTTFEMGFEPPDTVQVDTACFSAVPTAGRNEDHLLIPGAIITATTVRANRFCGKILAQQTATTSVPGPFTMFFNSDRLFKTNAPEIGFSFSYRIIRQ